jgi:hypothetical protein
VICGWCEASLLATVRRDAKYCSQRCRQAAHRFAGEVDHPTLIGRLVDEFPSSPRPAATKCDYVEAAQLIGCPPARAQRWWVQWHGPIGSGYHITFSDVDIRVGRAWQALNNTRAGDRGKVIRRLRESAERAVRAAPRRWLLVEPGAAATFDDPAAAIEAWSRDRVCWLVDLERTP